MQKKKKQTPLKSQVRKISINLRPDIFSRFETLRASRKYIPKTVWFEAAIEHYLDLVEAYGFNDETLRPKVTISADHSASKPQLKSRT
jgi:hypothetical protein